MSNGQNNHPISSIHSTVTDLDKRVSLLEARADRQSEDMEEMKKTMTENKELSMKILDTMQSYRESDTTDRRRLLVGIILTLFSVVGTLLVVMVKA